MTKVARTTTPWIVAAIVATLVPACAARQHQQQLVSCRSSNSAFFLLEAQAVPSATFIPCVLPLPAGWSFGGSDVRSGLARFWLDSDRAGLRAAELTLTRTCDTSGAVPAPLVPGTAGLSRYDQSTDPGHPDALSYFRFIGGCVTYRLSFAKGAAPRLFNEADHALAFTPRSVYVTGVRDDTGLPLCGAGAPGCPG